MPECNYRDPLIAYLKYVIIDIKLFLLLLYSPFIYKYFEILVFLLPTPAKPHRILGILDTSFNIAHQYKTSWS